MQFLRFDEGMDGSSSIINRIRYEYGEVIANHLRDLTPAEIKVVNRYQGCGFININSSLRRKVPFRLFNGRAIRILTKLLSRKTIPDNLIVYKGRSAKKFKGVSKNIICDPAFLSTSLNKYVAFGFCKSYDKTLKRELLEIQIPKGTNGLILDTGECEVILRPKTEFEIINVISNYAIPLSHNSGRHPEIPVTKIELRLKNV